MPNSSVVKITKSAVDKVQPGETIWDTEIKGFGVRCQKSHKSYLLKCTLNGRQKWITIGKHGSPWTPELARDKARAFLVSVKNGIDPTAASRQSKPGIRVSSLCDRYITEHATPHKKPSSAKTDRQLIENHIRPLLGRIYVDELTTEQVTNFQSDALKGKTAPPDPVAVQKKQRGGKTVRGGKGVANRSLALLSKMLNLAEEWGYRPKGSNPVSSVKRFKETAKERFLSAVEFERLGSTLDDPEVSKKIGPHAVAAIRLLILTGCRLGEVLSLKWIQLDTENRWFALSDSKTGPKKIHLSQPALDVIRTIPRILDNPFVIAGTKEGKALVNLQKPWSVVRQQAKLNDVRMHDLRHSFASSAIMNGVPIKAVGKLLGHASAQTTERYAHLADDYLTKQSELVGDVISTRLAPATRP